MAFPKISVIVPVYNAEKYLHRCIDSILAQTFTDFELLLIDDGSKDKSGVICDEYAVKDSRVRVFHKGNGGVSSARNVGLEHAEGEWITFADSDDYVEIEWLRTFADNLYGVDIVVSGIRFISQGEKRELGVELRGNVSDALIFLKTHSIFGYLFNKCFRREYIKNNKLLFDEAIIFKEDEEFFLRYMTKISKIYCLKEAYYNYIYPDFSSKYSSVDNFGVNLSLFENIRKLLPADSLLYESYLKESVNAFFECFPVPVNLLKERKYRLERFCNIVKKDIKKVEHLSVLSKWFILYPSYFSVLFFQMKGYIAKNK